MTKLRLAITGLKGAGKTVFITSLLNHLLDGGPTTLGVFAREGAGFSAREKPLPPTIRRFPYERHIESFRRPDPVWPESTQDVSEFHIELKLRRGRRRFRALQLEIVDYPGERLVDLPMVAQSFEEWSLQALKEAGQPSRSDHSKEWLTAVNAIPPGSRPEAEAVKGAVEAYHACLQRAMDAGLVLIQPSAVLLRSDDSRALDLNFCPLPEEVRKASPDVARAFRQRYDAYVSAFVKSFADLISHCSRQIVLVDVLRILRLGVHAYNDIRRCLTQVLDVFGYSRPISWTRPLDWARWLWTGGRQVERVAFLASKADQATSSNRNRLTVLLKELTRTKRQDLAILLSQERILFNNVAAHRCTRDCSVDYQGRPLAVLEGVRRDKAPENVGPWYPGEAPEQWPEDDWDPEDMQFRFPDFLPPRLPLRDGVTIDQLNLDAAFYAMVKDYIP